MRALRIARSDLLASLLVYLATLVLAATGAPGAELVFLVAIVSTGSILLSSVACVALQGLRFLPGRRER